MRHRFVVPAVLAMAVALSLPAMALAKDHGRGNGNGHGNQENRGGGQARERGGDQGGWQVQRGDQGGGWQSQRGQGVERRQVAVERQTRSWSPAFEMEQRVRREARAPQQREGGRTWASSPRTYSGTTRYRGDYPQTTTRTYNGYRVTREPIGSTRYRGTTRYGGGFPSARYGYGGTWGPRYYYGSYWRRPHFYRSSFSIGFVIASTPRYSYYRYYDPFCGIAFRSLGSYYDHCDWEGHPAVIEVIDSRYGGPIATCIYDGGAWVVDDCADWGY